MLRGFGGGRVLKPAVGVENLGIPLQRTYAMPHGTVAYGASRQDTTTRRRAYTARSTGIWNACTGCDGSLRVLNASMASSRGPACSSGRKAHVNVE